MLVEGQCEGLGAAHGGRKARTPAGNDIFNCSRATVSEGWRASEPHKRPASSTTTSPHRGGRASSDPAPLPRSRCLRRRHHAEAPLQAGLAISARSVDRDHRGIRPSRKTSIAYRPRDEPPCWRQVSKAHSPRTMRSGEPLERGLRQLLADKVSGVTSGCGCSVPELLRLGVLGPPLLLDGSTGPTASDRGWPCSWSMKRPCDVTGLRGPPLPEPARDLELVNGLPFLASDTAVHELLAARTVDDSRRLQESPSESSAAPSGHFRRRLPGHRPAPRAPATTERHVPCPVPMKKTGPSRWLKRSSSSTSIPANRFASPRAPRHARRRARRRNCSGLAWPTSSAPTRGDARPGGLRALHGRAPGPRPVPDRIRRPTVPMSNRSSLLKKLRALPPEIFQRRWAGY